MSYRFMRMIVFFDLPVETLQERRDYTHFRKFLLKSGFMQMQESVYCKLALNQTAVSAMQDSIRKHRPPKGLVQLLVITEKQYARMDYIVGANEGDIINTDERFVEL
jgi:CRISPR-associated protein Cas2